MKRFAVIIFFLAALNTELLYSQKDSSRFGIGLNFMTMYAGTPELQFDCFWHKNFGFTSSGGYIYMARRGGAILVGDAAEISSLYGSYFKLGVKFRTRTKPSKHPFLWYGQISYVGSFYNETGKHSPDTTEVNLSGFVSGIATVVGFEWRIYVVDLRLGFQTTFYYSERKHLGYGGHTYQPGIGSSGVYGFPNQAVLGLVYKFGNLSKKKT